MIQLLLHAGAAGLLMVQGAMPTTYPARDPEIVEACREIDFQSLGRNPLDEELRCRYDVRGPGRFGLLSHADVPVYQPATPMPGTHMIGVPGQPRPLYFESFEEWEWRTLRRWFGPEVHRVHRDLALLDPSFAAIIVRFEARLAEAGVGATRLETWRSADRQAYLFQQGRSRPGPLATTTLTSWHTQMDATGMPAGRAVDYNVGQGALRRFHQIAEEVGLATYGHDSYDPGHVYLPTPNALPSAEIVVLRTIPRVPEVTLSTGLPVDRRLPPGGREALHRRSRDFAALPFLPYPIPTVATPFRRAEPLLSLAPLTAPSIPRVSSGKPPATEGSDAVVADRGASR